MPAPPRPGEIPHDVGLGDLVEHVQLHASAKHTQDITGRAECHTETTNTPGRGEGDRAYRP